MNVRMGQGAGNNCIRHKRARVIASWRNACFPAADICAKECAPGLLQVCSRLLSSKVGKTRFKLPHKVKYSFKDVRILYHRTYCSRIHTRLINLPEIKAIFGNQWSISGICCHAHSVRVVDQPLAEVDEGVNGLLVLFAMSL